jgi:FixJ family two-component response regulator
MSEPTQTILIVDDDNDTRAVIAKVLEPLGAAMVEATTGRHALNVLKQQEIDVVVSDLVMPRMSGMMLLHSMLEQGYSMPFVLTTGFSDKDSAIQALRLGAFDYLEKPFDETDMQSVVAEALRVSKEQRRLRGLRRADGAEADADGRRQAEVQVIKIRALRETSEEPRPSEPPANGSDRTWRELRDLFVQEAESQLVFCEASLKTVLERESAARELAFAIRVVQSVRVAAESLRVSDVAGLAWSFESALAACKVTPESITQETVQLLLEANTRLRQRVAVIGDQGALRVQARLDELTATLLRSAPGADKAG